MRLRHGQLLRSTVEDSNGRPLGKVIATSPEDGGGEPDLVLVQMTGRFARRRWLSVHRAQWSPEKLRLAISRDEAEDAPCASDRRWGDPAALARAFWRTALD